MLHRVGDVKMLAVYARRFERAVEEPARRADERQAFLVFLVAGLLSDQHHARVRVARAEHRLRGVRPERAVLALARLRAQLLEGSLRALRHPPFRMRGSTEVRR
jgi:hypothetical protein